MSLLGGDAPVYPTSGAQGGRQGGSRPIGSLPPSARVPAQYPAGVPTGVGGGNAGASVPPPLRGRASGSSGGGGGGRSNRYSAPAPARAPVPTSRAAAPGRTPVIVRDSGTARQVSLAAQNAGLPAVNWSAGNPEFDAAGAAGAAAAAARQAQGGRGVLSPMAEAPQASFIAPAGAFGGEQVDMAVFAPNAGRDVAIQQGVARIGLDPKTIGQSGLDVTGGYTGSVGPEAMALAQGSGPAMVDTRSMARPAGSLPDASDPGSQAFWDRADMQTWAQANRGLAEDLVRRKGYRPTNWDEIMGNQPAQMPSPRVMEFPGVFQDVGNLGAGVQAYMGRNNPAMAQVSDTTYPGAFTPTAEDLDRLKSQLIGDANAAQGGRLADVNPTTFPGAFAPETGLGAGAQAFMSGDQPAMAAQPSTLAPAGAFELSQEYLDRIKRMGTQLPAEAAPAAQPTDRFAPETDLNKRLLEQGRLQLVPGMGTFSPAGAFQSR